MALRSTAAVLIQCGPLRLLPTGAARVGVPTSLTSAPFSDVFELVYASSGSGLRKSLVALEEHSEGGDVLVVANPTRHDVPPLPYAESEGVAVAAAYSAMHVDSYFREQATTQALFARKVDPHIAHFACHGTSDHFNPNASSLLLSDGDLTVQELTRAHLGSCRLAVLSSCQSGQNSLFFLPDEGLGVVGRLLESGTVTVVGSLWPVADRATALLMSKLHELLAGQGRGMPAWSPAKALQEAQRWLRELTSAEEGRYLSSRGSLSTTLSGEASRGPFAWFRGRANTRPYADPVFWAAFVCFGP